MPVAEGTRLGLYEIRGLIGVGGMGEVYRARDTKLGREVAVKVLPDSFARDPERLARFEREARVLASLNHPGIRRSTVPEAGSGYRWVAVPIPSGLPTSESSTTSAATR